MSEMIERIARALCEADGYDPNHLEPGDDPYMNNTTVIDGRNRKNEPCHFFWRHYDQKARATLHAMREPTKEMEDAGRHEMESPPCLPKFVWRGMIDEALSPPSPSPATVRGVKE